MRTIAMIALLTFPLLAGFFPKAVHTSIKSADGNAIKLNSKFPVDGMSGVVIHSYASGLTAITSRIAQTASDGSVQLIQTDDIHHEELPTIKTPVKRGDKVIGGYLYNNVLLLAPDAETYAKITRAHKKTWIHPDLFALFLSVEGEDKPTKENLSKFARKYQVGLVYIVRKDAEVLMDPISGKIIAKKATSKLPAEGQFPFFMRFGTLKSGWFGSEAKGNYYNMIGAL
jgi:hypothetical protein